MYNEHDIMLRVCAGLSCLRVRVYLFYSREGVKSYKYPRVDAIEAPPQK